jgi:hypothetical protein
VAAAAEDVLHTTVAQMNGVKLQIGRGPMPPDWYEMLDLVTNSVIDTNAVIDKTVSLEQLPDAIKRGALARSAGSDRLVTDSAGRDVLTTIPEVPLGDTRMTQPATV